MFNDSNSFYYCPDGDLTNTIQRQHTVSHDSKTEQNDSNTEQNDSKTEPNDSNAVPSDSKTEPNDSNIESNKTESGDSKKSNKLKSYWKKADNRFFWNKPMLQDLINSKVLICSIYSKCILKM